MMCELTYARLFCSVLVIPLGCSWRYVCKCIQSCAQLQTRCIRTGHAAFIAGCQCITQATPLAAGTRAWKFGMDRIYKPFYNNLMISNKGAICCLEYGHKACHS
jgi:hypothetical protein